MTVAAEDLLAPAGRLDAAVLWPLQSDDTIREKLDAYLTHAETKTTAWADEPEADRDVVRTWWAEYRAFDAVLLEMEASPSTADFRDEGSGSFLATQMNLMRDRRGEALAAFQALGAELAAAGTVEVTPPVPRSSVSAPISFRF